MQTTHYVDRSGPSLTSENEVVFLYKLKITARCFFLGLALASLLCWMVCGQGLQYDVILSHLYERYTCSMCKWCKVAQFVKIMYGCLGIFSKNISTFISLLIVAFFHASKNPCNISA